MDGNERIKSVRDNGYAPLHIAIRENNLESVDKILEKSPNFIDLKTNDGDTPLNLAAKLGKQEIVKHLIFKKNNADEPNCKGFTPFLNAVNNGHLNLLEFLLTESSLTYKTKCGFLAIHYASGQNYVKIMEFLIKIDENAVKIKTLKEEFTALHVAAANAKLDAVKYLIEHNADVNANDHMNRTPLHLSNNEEITKLLLEKGSELNAFCIHGYTPLHLAAKNNKYDIVKCLLNRGAEVNTKNKYGVSPIHSAAIKKHYHICDLLNQDKALLSFLIRQKSKHPEHFFTKLINNTDFDEMNSSDYSSIHFAACHGQLNIIKKIMYICDKKSQIINTKSSKGYTPLYVSVAMKSDHELCYLIHLGANASIADKNGVTPFHLACYHGKSRSMVSTLEKENSDLVNQQTKAGSTPLHIASTKGYYSFVELLVKRFKANLEITDSNGYTPLHAAVCKDRLEIVLFLLNWMKRNNIMRLIDSQTNDGSTPLCLAAQQGNLTMVELLIRCGGSADIQNKKGYSPLHLAAWKGHVEVIKFLVDKVKSVDTKTKFGFTPLHLAALLGNTEILKTLMKYGDIDAQDTVGRTPLYLAAIAHQTKVVQILIENGADIKLTQKRGWAPIHIAVYKLLKYSNFDTVKLIVKSNVDCINWTTGAGDTSLHLAGWVGGNIELIRWLMNHSEGNIINKFGITPLDLAVNQGLAHPPEGCNNKHCQQCNLYKTFLEKNHNLNYLKNVVNSKEVNRIEYEVMIRGELSTVKYLLNELKVDFTCLTALSKRSPIHVAAEFNRAQILKYLKNKGYNLDIKIPELNETPLYVAVIEKNQESIEMLINLGVQVNLGDRYGWTPLHVAVYRNYHEIIHYLCLTNSCDINKRSETGKTPLYIGVQYNCFKAVQKLINFKADPTLADSSGWTPLKVAEYNFHQTEPEAEEKTTGVQLYRENVEKVFNLLKKYTEQWKPAQNIRK